MAGLSQQLQLVRSIIFGHLKQEHRLDRSWLKGAQGDALNAIGTAAGYNLHWLMRAIALLRAWIRAALPPPACSPVTPSTALA